MANGNDRNLSVRGKTALQGGNMLAAEAVGAGAEVALLNVIDKAPVGFTQGVKNALKSIIKPFQRQVESALNFTKGIEGHENFEKRLHQTEEQRLEGLVDKSYHFGLAGLAGYGTAFGTQHVLNKATGVPMATGHSLKLYAMDGAVHLGAIALLGQPCMETVTQRGKAAVNCVAQSLGMPPEKADSVALFTMGNMVPNGIAALFNVGMMHRHNLKEAAKVASHMHL